MMGDEGQPNFSEMAATKSASRCPSHWRKMLHASHVTRFVCGPADEPMTPTKLPQAQARCRCIFMPTISEADGADDGGDEDPKKSSCNICAALIDGTPLARIQEGLRLTKGPHQSAFGQFLRGLSEAVFCFKPRSHRGSRRPSRRATQPQLALAPASTASARSPGSSRYACP